MLKPSLELNNSCYRSETSLTHTAVGILLPFSYLYLALLYIIAVGLKKNKQVDRMIIGAARPFPTVTQRCGDGAGYVRRVSDQRRVQNTTCDTSVDMEEI